MSNKCMCPIRMTANIHPSIKLFTLCMASICLLTCCRISISYTKMPILNVTPWCSFGTGTVRLFGASLVDSWQDNYFSTAFLPVMASNHSSMTNKLELLKNLTCWPCAWALNRMYWQWAGPKFHSLWSTHHLIGTYSLPPRLISACAY